MDIHRTTLGPTSERPDQGKVIYDSEVHLRELLCRKSNSDQLGVPRLDRYTTGTIKQQI